MVFVRIFSKEFEAEQFAAAHNSRVEISYNWDSYYGLVKEFLVKF